MPVSFFIIIIIGENPGGRVASVLLLVFFNVNKLATFGAIQTLFIKDLYYFPPVGTFVFEYSAF